MCIQLSLLPYLNDGCHYTGNFFISYYKMNDNSWDRTRIYGILRQYSSIAANYSSRFVNMPYTVDKASVVLIWAISIVTLI
jgi:hypothetical protein